MASNAENVSIWWRHHGLDALCSRASLSPAAVHSLAFLCINKGAGGAIRCNAHMLKYTRAWYGLSQNIYNTGHGISTVRNIHWMKRASIQSSGRYHDFFPHTKQMRPEYEEDCSAEARNQRHLHTFLAHMSRSTNHFILVDLTFLMARNIILEKSQEPFQVTFIMTHTFACPLKTNILWQTWDNHRSQNHIVLCSTHPKWLQGPNMC